MREQPLQARSVFVIGGREFVVRPLLPEQLNRIQLLGRGANLDDPAVCRRVVLLDLFILLYANHPDLSIAWLNKNLDTETAAGLMDNLNAQIALAIASRKAPATGTA